MAATTRAIALASRWFDEQTYLRTFEPLIADWQREWQEAPHHRRATVSVKGWWAFISAALLLTPRILATPASREVTDRIAIRVTRIAVIGASLLMIPAGIEMFNLWRHGSTWVNGELFLFTIPGALLLTFPFAMAGAVDAIRGRGLLLPHVERAIVLKFGLFAAAFMLIGGGWVVPASNHAARVATNPPGMNAPLRAMRELSTFELVTDPARANVFAPGTNLAARSESLTRELNSRAMLVAFPVVLIWLRWRAYNPARHRRSSPLPVFLATAASLAVVIGSAASGAWLERQGLAPIGTTYWMPLAIFIAWGIAARRGTQSQDARTNAATA